jgi:HEPN domain-containing protein
MKPETKKWLKLSDDDLRMAKAAVELEIWSQCLFHCQQAIEKILKGRLVEADMPVPRIHDLPELAGRCA